MLLPPGWKTTGKTSRRSPVLVDHFKVKFSNDDFCVYNNNTDNMIWQLVTYLLSNKRLGPTFCGLPLGFFCSTSHLFGASLPSSTGLVGVSQGALGTSWILRCKDCTLLLIDHSCYFWILLGNVHSKFVHQFGDAFLEWWVHVHFPSMHDSTHFLLLGISRLPCDL